MRLIKRDGTESGLFLSGVSGLLKVLKTELDDTKYYYEYIINITISENQKSQQEPLCHRSVV